MQFDDRLATVLKARPESEAMARIQYRQLLDLLGSAPAGGAQVEAGYGRLAALSKTIPAATRAKLISEAGLRLRSPDLLAELADDAPPVALAAVRRAELSEAQWLHLVVALPVAARGVLRHRRDLGPRVEARLEQLGIHDRALPAGADAAAPALSEGIGAIVRRIEAYRRAREEGATAPRPDNDTSPESPRLPLGEEHFLHAPAPRAFDFATDSTGRITWADPGVAPLTVGIRLLGQGTPGALAFQRRLPIRSGAIELEGPIAIAGAWQIDAAPTFDPPSGAFTGYAGRLRRSPTASSAPASSDSDRIRQVLHELRTPINAIQGFAEIIQQQLFGPVPHAYRALAANIAGDSAHILAGFEELERLARLETGAIAIEPGQCDLTALVEATIERLLPFSASRNSGFATRAKLDPLIIGLASAEAERLIWRLLATLAGTSLPGEVLQLRLKPTDRGIRLKVALPEALATRDDRALFDAAIGAVPQAISAGMFGVGFALRLCRAEARAAGGALERRGNELRLLLPGLTATAPDHSQAEGASGAAAS